MSLRCWLGIHDYDVLGTETCNRCGKQNPKYRRAVREWERTRDNDDVVDLTKDL